MSALARVEVPAALWRKQRLGELASSDAELLVAAFEADFQGTADEPPAFAAVALSADVLDAAAEVSATQGLRAYDAAQLASALAARAVDRSCIHFACFDGQLRDGAARSGFGLVPDYQGQ